MEKSPGSMGLPSDPWACLMGSKWMRDLPKNKGAGKGWKLDPSITADTTQPWVHGKPCKRCGSTVRLISPSRCVRCRKQDKKESEARRKRNPEKYQRRRHPLFKSHGLNQKFYDDLFALQNGACAICRKPETNGNRLSIDHCHATNSFRGLLCNRCNRGLGQFCDNAEALRKAADYLEKNAWAL